jgi:hypothetical protein
MPANANNDGDGCACLGAALLIALVIAALISLAALVDPFSWMPSVDEVWSDCDDDYGTDRDECALENRFPGFWVHAIVNLVYTAVAGVAVAAFAGSVGEFRAKRTARFADAKAAAEHREARDALAAASAALGVLAALPIVVAAV